VEIVSFGFDRVTGSTFTHISQKLQPNLWDFQANVKIRLNPVKKIPRPPHSARLEGEPTSPSNKGELTISPLFERGVRGDYKLKVLNIKIIMLDATVT
jgi:hypothetical protein